MNLLVDTHVLIWLAVGDRRLSRPAREALISPDNQVSVSVVSEWEVALKSRDPAFRLPRPFGAIVAQSDFEPIPLAFGTPEILESLPFHHKDPFDRMLIAQALLHRMTFVTGDRAIHRYQVPVLW